MSDSNRVALRYDIEGTYGVAPTGPGTWQNLRFTSESLRQETTTVTSAEIRNDRQVADVVRTQINASGDIAGELSYGTYDELFMVALLSATWTTPVTVGPGTTFSVTAGSGDYTIADSGSGFGSINVGEWVHISGFSNALNNGYAKVTAAAAGSITVTGNGNGVTEGAGATVTIVQGAMITNGTTFRSLSFEKEFTDLSTEFELFTGCAIDGMGVTVTADGLITLNFAVIGQDGARTTAKSDAGTPLGVNSNEVMAAVDNVVKICEGTAYTEIDATQFSFSVANNLRQLIQIGDLGPNSLGTGTVNVTGGLQAYLIDTPLTSKHFDYTQTALAIVFEDAAGQAYVMDFPLVQYTSGQAVAGGQNQDIIADLGFEAFRNPASTETVTIRIHRFA